MPRPSIRSNLLVLLSRRSPRSSLFPYTTLFRSLRLRVDACGLDDLAPRCLYLRTTGRTKLADIKKCTRDRKSTRLNSSHTVISYAVFCLKKKKETNQKTYKYEKVTQTCSYRIVL